ncbi:hypothetical protein D3C80_2044700 [compost metagenome]
MVRLHGRLPVVKEPVGSYFPHLVFVIVGFPVIFIPGQRIDPLHVLLFGPDA